MYVTTLLANAAASFIRRGNAFNDNNDNIDSFFSNAAIERNISTSNYSLKL